MAKGIADINWSDSHELFVQKVNSNFKQLASPRMIMQALNDPDNARDLRTFWESIREQYMTGDNAAEYVVATGVDGIWRWTIYSSGICECWGKADPITVSSWTLWDNNTYISPVLGGAAFPADFFDSAPYYATADFVATANDAWLGYTDPATAQYAPKVYLYKPQSTTSTKGYFLYHAKGIVSGNFPYNPGVSYPPDGDLLEYGTEP